MANVLWNRLKYVLSPQFDIYEQVARIVRGRVTDIGFGTGFGMHLFSVNAKEVIGYEVDEEALKFAEKVFPIAKLCFRYGSIEKSIDDTPSDFVVMIDVIEHLKDSKHALANVKKLMVLNGTFICSTPNRLSRYRKSECHVKEYSPKEFETLLKNVFVNVSIRDYKLEPIVSQYENPMIAICRNEK